MAQFDQSDSECVVYVYREGIASAVGHDLAIEVTDFTLDVSEGGDVVEGRFAADSLEVRHAVEEREAKPGKLSSKDKEKIERNIRKDVLETARFPVITFRSTDVSTKPGAVHVEGVLSLHGVERAVSFEGRVDDGATVIEGRLEQPDFDIAPFKALLGALKIKPEVDVVLRVPYAPS